jgi:hypothetical protein
LSNRVAASEQLFAHGLSEDASRASAANFSFQKLPARSEHPVLGHEVVEVGAAHDRHAVFAAVDDRKRFLGNGRHSPHTGKLRLQRLHIIRRHE